MKNKGDIFRVAHSAAVKDLKEFVLLKNFSGKLTGITLFVLSLFVIITTGNFVILVFSVSCAVLYAFCYYLTKLAEHFKTESEKQGSDERE